MSKRHPLDELFHDHLADASASVPDDMWERIQNAREPKRRRPPFPTWWMLGLFLLVGTGAIMYQAQSETAAPTIGHFPAVVEPIPTTIVLPQTVVNYPSAPLEMEATIAVATELPNVVTPEEAPTVSVAQAIVGTPSGKTVITTKVDQERRNSTTTLSPTEEETLLLEAERPANRQPEKVTIPATPPPTQANTITTEPQKAAGPHQRRRLQRVAELPTRSFEPDIKSTIKLFANHPPRCAKFTGPFFRWDAELLAGPAYAHSTLTAKTSESEAHLQQRLNSEFSEWSYTTLLRLAATTKSGLSIRSGVGYTQINERFEHEIGSKWETTVVIGPDGQIIAHDSTFVERYVETSNNRLRFVEIPVLLGYEKQLGKLRVGAQAGAFLGVAFDATGTTYSPATGDPIAFGQEGESNVLPIFRQQATAAWYGSMTVVYNLASRYSIVAEPYFKSYPRVLSTSGYDLEQDYWMAGMQVGLRVRL